jgi:hypothetical protein
MVENLDKLIERDGKIEVILQKAESLSTYSKTYRANVRKIKSMGKGKKSQNSNEEQKDHVRCHINHHSRCK